MPWYIRKNMKPIPPTNSHNYSSTAMEWTREKTLALIQEYRKRRGLWDMTHEDYRKKEVKQSLLVEVSETLGDNIPIMEVEKKFHTLRTQYHREINRMKRKEPYNSKWFGFKYLQFLSSPKACRSNKGRIKAEITEEGTVTTKYIIREAITPVGHETSMGSGNENEEFVTVQHRSTAISYEAVPTSTATSTTSNRSNELEKLIEETTKDVEDIDETKSKMTIKVSVPMDHQSHHHQDSYSGGELQISNVESEHQDLHHQMDDAEGMTMQHATSDEELNYQTNTSNHGVTSVSTVSAGAHTQSSSASTVHTIPARIIKIQRRDTQDTGGDYYEQQLHTPQHPHQQQHHHHSHQHQQQHQQHHIQTVTPMTGNGSTAKRIYYDPAGHHTTTILTSTPSHQQQQSNVSLINASTASIGSSPTNSKIHLRNSLAAAAAAGTPNALSTTAMNLSPSAAVLRDDFTTFGEYVANEMREIKSREILLTLKHKINTALFEANMQELQK